MLNKTLILTTFLIAMMSSSYALDFQPPPPLNLLPPNIMPLNTFDLSIRFNHCMRNSGNNRFACDGLN